MNPVAKMGFVPRGIYNNGATYDFLDFVYYNGNTYVAKKLTVGNEPQENNEYWQIFAKGGIEDVGIQFEEATERQNIQSGEDAPTLFGKIKKWYADFKEVAFSGSYNDLSDQPTAKDIGALPSSGGTVGGNLAISGNINVNNIFPFESRTQSSAVTLCRSLYNGGSAKIEKLSNNSVIGASPILAESDILNTVEEISANTDTNKIAGATAVKSLKSDLTNSINETNSNLTEMVSIINIINGNADIDSDFYHTLCSFTLPVGEHLIIIVVSFPSNDVGFRRIGISGDGKSFNMNRFAVKTAQAVSGNYTTVFLSYIHLAISEAPLYLMAQQNSGSTLLNCTYGISAISLKSTKRYRIPYEFLNRHTY